MCMREREGSCFSDRFTVTVRICCSYNGVWRETKNLFLPKYPCTFLKKFTLTHNERKKKGYDEVFNAVLALNGSSLYSNFILRV